mmetsp:Transcript_141947/g.441336  ORF Transcript_141947/g.441336 Transcript_141947/m.441336 type:complete len:106 (-) Transcript_141947:384-701(-)
MKYHAIGREVTANQGIRIITEGLLRRRALKSLLNHRAHLNQPCRWAPKSLLNHRTCTSPFNSRALKSLFNQRARSEMFSSWALKSPLTKTVGAKWRTKMTPRWNW